MKTALVIFAGIIPILALLNLALLPVIAILITLIVLYLWIFGETTVEVSKEDDLTDK